LPLYQHSFETFLHAQAERKRLAHKEWMDKLEKEKEEEALMHKTERQIVADQEIFFYMGNYCLHHKKEV
jgi:hypothetical protein